MDVVTCVDCKAAGITKARKIHLLANGIPAPGKRCREHYYAKRKSTRARARELRVSDLYDLTTEEVAELKEFQGGCCYVCRKAKGITKNLSIDHDHEVEKLLGVRASLRGLLCDPCNRIVIGRYNIAALKRAIAYLEDPPAQRMFRGDPPLVLD